jgi:phenylacetic acid degradation operon negative regulatory protein
VTGEDLGQPPRALILTVLGLYVREAGGWVSVRTLIRLLATVDVDDQAVRSSVSRLKRRGLLVAERRDGAAGYALSAYARGVLEIGDERIFARGDHELDQWALVVFSVPEDERQKRHTLRTRLTWLGFGTVSSGVWVGPGHLLPDARRVIEANDLSPYVDLFRAEYLAFGDPATKVAEWWDLDALDVQYRAFLDRAVPMLERWRTTEVRAPEASFADYVRALTMWRRLPYLDPGLPTALLPASWRGEEASRTFFELKELLEEPAHAYVDEIVH